MEYLEIRLLTPDDTQAFVRLRREALESEPFAFVASVEDDRGLDSVFVQQSLAKTDERAVFGAFAPELVGLVGIYRDPHQKTAHKAHIWGIYVQPKFRSSGIGDSLLSTAIGHARSSMPGVNQIHLIVSETAKTARRLYERHGFKIWGTEPRAMIYKEQSIAGHHLLLVLA